MKKIKKKVAYCTVNDLCIPKKVKFYFNPNASEVFKRVMMIVEVNGFNCIEIPVENVLKSVKWKGNFKQGFECFRVYAQGIQYHAHSTFGSDVQFETDVIELDEII